MRRVIGSVALLGVMLLALAWIEAAPQQPKAKNNRKSAATTASYGNADAITADELKEYEYFLASDELEGRYQPSRGYNVAAKYIAGRLHQWGLKPGGSTADTDGPLEPYLMPIELVSSQLNAAGMKLSLNMPPPPAGGGRGRAGGAAAVPAGPRSFEYTREWTMAAAAGLAAAAAAGQPVRPASWKPRWCLSGTGMSSPKPTPIPTKGSMSAARSWLLQVCRPNWRRHSRPQRAARGGGQGGAAAGGQGRGGAVANPLGEENTDFMTPQATPRKMERWASSWSRHCSS